MPTNNQLPPRENALFKRILKCYEQKQYKNGLKCAKQILSNPKFAQHGETLAMKGLTLNCLGKREEAFRYVRQGLTNDLRSHVCWHVYGLLQRSEKCYDEAIKCYRNALKWDKDNLQILRDLSLLQIQMRDIEGYKDTRYQLLVLRPTQRTSWIGYAMAYHLLQDYDMALKILEEFRKTQTPKAHDYEHSELLVYQGSVMQEAGRPDHALSHIQQYETQICDKLLLQETQAKIFMETGRLCAAEKEYRELVKRNPENWSYYAGLERILELTCTDGSLPAARHQLYKDLSADFPKAQAPLRLPLTFVSGDTFSQMVDSYLRSRLRKGIPALFVDLRSLYCDIDKVNRIAALVTEYEECLTDPACGRFSREDTEEKEVPSTVLWVWFYLAQHFDHVGDTVRALHYVNTAIKHTPTLIELYVAKARIYKHAGDYQQAVTYLDEAQSLDTADRYINSKCAKYLLRANKISESEEMCGKFTRENTPPAENLNEMQCMWFQIECGCSHRRMNKLGEALKKFHEVDRHFTEIIEDQFDFHTYCMRKMTLRSYVELLRLEDDLRGHDFYFRAASNAIEIYLRLHDKPYSEDEALAGANADQLTAAELKKLKNKQRKAQKKLELEQQRTADQDKKDKGGKAAQQEPDTEGPKVEQLVPSKLVRVQQPLEEAAKLLRPLQTMCHRRVESHLLAFEVALRQGRLLLMLQAITRARKINRDHPDLHTCIVRFHNLAMEASGLEEPVSLVLQEGVQNIYAGQNASQINEMFLSAHQNSLPHRLAGAKMLYHLDPASAERALQVATCLADELDGVTIKACQKVVDTLAGGEVGPGGPAAVESYLAKCHVRFPLATAFRPPGMEPPRDFDMTDLASPAAPDHHNHVDHTANGASPDDT